VIEASACGRAVLASGSLEGGGIVLPLETWYLVPRRSPDALAAALQHLIENAPLRERLGRTARRYAEEHFAAGRNAARVVEVYEEVLNGRG
jgi:glycosyltransferase involved in cell wall biosynthesis